MNRDTVQDRADGAGEYEHFLRAVRDELGPVGIIEGVLADRAALAVWKLREATTDGRLGEMPLDRRVDRMLRDALEIFNERKAERESSESPPPPAPPTPPPGRFTYDEAISTTSPVIHGTWVTVDEVIDRGLDGHSRAEILREFPELTPEDVDACLAHADEIGHRPEG